MADLYNQLVSSNPMQYGQVEQNEWMNNPLNDVALNDDWALPTLVSGGLSAFRGTLGALSNFYRAKNVYDIWDKRKYWGIPFRKASGNPKNAVQVLRENETGFVPNADGKGVDFVWGKYIPPIRPGAKGKGYGLSHSKGRRIEQGYNGNKFLDEVPELFKNGNKYYKPGHNDRYYIGDGIKEGIIRTDYNGLPWKWLNSVYYLYK